MSKVTITSPALNVIKGNSKASGKPYELRIQTGYLHSVDSDGVAAEIPDKFEFILADGEAAYPRGHYSLAPSALYVGRDGRLSVQTRLVAMVAAPASK
jgi:Helix-destabilising protein